MDQSKDLEELTRFELLVNGSTGSDLETGQIFNEVLSILGHTPIEAEVVLIKGVVILCKICSASPLAVSAMKSESPALDNFFMLLRLIPNRNDDLTSKLLQLITCCISTHCPAVAKKLDLSLMLQLACENTKSSAVILEIIDLFTRLTHQLPEYVQRGFQMTNWMLSKKDEHIIVASCCKYIETFTDNQESLHLAVNSGLCRTLVHLLSKDLVNRVDSVSQAILQSAVSSIGNIATGEDNATYQLIRNGVIPRLEMVMKHAHSQPVVVKTCVWTLSNIAAGGSEACNHIIEQLSAPDDLSSLVWHVHTQRDDADADSDLCWLLNNVVVTVLRPSCVLKLVQSRVTPTVLLRIANKMIDNYPNNGNGTRNNNIIVPSQLGGTFAIILETLYELIKQLVRVMCAGDDALQSFSSCELGDLPAPLSRTQLSNLEMLYSIFCRERGYRVLREAATVNMLHGYLEASVLELGRRLPWTRRCNLVMFRSMMLTTMTNNKNPHQQLHGNSNMTYSNDLKRAQLLLNSSLIQALCSRRCSIGICSFL